jgi:hypothetical protein
MNSSYWFENWVTGVQQGQLKIRRGIREEDVGMRTEERGVKSPRLYNGPVRGRPRRELGLGTIFGHLGGQISSR